MGWVVFKGADWFGLPDFFIQATLAGAKEDRASKHTSVYTPADPAQMDPIWRENFTFTVSDVDQAVLVLAAWDKDAVKDDFLGQNAFPVADLQQGEHHIPLLSNEGDALEGSPLLV